MDRNPGHDWAVKSAATVAIAAKAAPTALPISTLRGGAAAMKVSVKAELLFSSKDVMPDGGVIVMRLWRVPSAVPPTEHGYK